MATRGRAVNGGDGPTNNDRAEWACAALDAFAKRTGQAGDDYLNEDQFREIAGDLLCGLFHAATNAGMTPRELLSRARVHCGSEVNEAADDDGMWTVLGLYDSHSNTFLVAGVIEGEHNTADTDHHADGHGQYQRMAHSVEAEDADEAAYLVTQQVEDPADEGEDEAAEVEVGNADGWE
jgi:hypothetical protein